MKKIITTAICTVAILTMFAGCSKKETAMSAQNGSKEYHLVGDILVEEGETLNVSENAWNKDYVSSVKYAKKTGKDLLLFFNTNDPLTVEFKNNVTSTKEFINKYSKDYVLVDVDFTYPIDEDDAANSQIGIDYRVRSFPSIYFVTNEGFVLDVVEIVSDNINDMQAFNERYELAEQTMTLVKEAISNVKATEGVDRASAIDTLLTTVKTPTDDLLVLEKEIATLDPKNQTGLVGKYIIFEALQEAYDIAYTGDANDNGENAKKAASVIVKAAKNKMVDADLKQNAYYQAAYLLATSSNPDYKTVISYLNKSYKASKKSENAQSILQTINDVKKMQKELKNQSKNSAKETSSEENTSAPETTEQSSQEVTQ